MSVPTGRGWHHREGDPEGTTRWWNGQVWGDRLNGVTGEATASAKLDPISPALIGRSRTSVLVVTMNDIPGYQVVTVHGDVFGLTVRVRNAFSNFGASMRSVVGGEVGGYTKLLSDARTEARARLIDAAIAKGANAIIAMRFDCNEIGDIMSEIAAYGTAVTIQPVTVDR